MSTNDDFESAKMDAAHTIALFNNAHKRLLNGQDTFASQVRREFDAYGAMPLIYRYRIGVDGDSITHPGEEGFSAGYPTDLAANFPHPIWDLPELWRSARDEDENEDVADLVQRVINHVKANQDGWDEYLSWHAEDVLEFDRKSEDHARETEFKRHLRDQDALAGFVMPDFVSADTPVAPIKWTVEGLLADGHAAVLSGQQKRGKTTLGLNLVKSLTTGEDFIGMPVQQLDGTAVVVNLEMASDQISTWGQDLGLGNSTQWMNLKGQAHLFNVLVPAIRRQWVEKLRSAQCEFLLIDPLFELAHALGITETNDSIPELLGALRSLQVEADIRNMVIIHHAGHRDDSRSRGGSSIGAWADSNWNLRGEGRDRTFEAEGRDVREKFSVRFSGEDTRRYLRAEDMPDGNEVDATPVILEKVGETSGITQNKLTDALRDAGVPGSKSAHMRMISDAVEAGVIVSRKEGSAKTSPVRYYLP